MSAEGRLNDPKKKPADFFLKEMTATFTRHPICSWFFLFPSLLSIAASSEDAPKAQ
jgi:hypothetical protein